MLKDGVGGGVLFLLQWGVGTLAREVVTLWMRGETHHMDQGREQYNSTNIKDKY